MSSFRPRSVPLRNGEAGDDRNDVIASIAPDVELAEGGYMTGGGNGAVKGILNRFVMGNASLIRS